MTNIIKQFLRICSFEKPVTQYLYDLCRLLKFATQLKDELLGVKFSCSYP
jgi:hypothetical protein